MAMTCEVTEWRIVGDDLVRQLDFVGVEPETTVQLPVTVKVGDTGMIETLPYIMLAPAVSEAPEAYLAVLLGTMDQSVESGFLNVRTTRTPGGANRFSIEDGEDARNRRRPRAGAPARTRHTVSCPFVPRRSLTGSCAASSWG
jgi:hypothetical protein